MNDGGGNSTGRRRPSIFSSPSSSSSSRSGSEESDSGISRTEMRKSHARAEKWDRITKESQDRARSREIERIQRDRGHDQGG